MFLRQLSSSSSSFLPRGRPPLRAGFRSSTSSSSSSSSSSVPRFPPAPHPCSVRGFPTRPPRLPYPSQHLVSGRTFNDPKTGHRSWRSFSSSPGLMMERPDREPPYKRRKNAEERRSSEEKEGQGKASKDGGSREGHQNHQDRHSRPNHWCKDGGQDRGKSRDNSSEKAAERTKSRDTDKQRTDKPDRNELPHRGRSTYHHPTQHPRARTESPKPKLDQDRVPVHKPNPWFKDRGSPDTQQQQQQQQQRTGTPFIPQHQWQVVGGNRDRRTPPPPGTIPPVRPQPDVQPDKFLQRHWEMSPTCSSDLQPPGVSAAFDFSVMSYNILSQDLLQDNAYLYRHCDPGVLPWSHRLPNLLSEIRQLDADILCLQEVQEDHYENQIKPALQALGYHCEYKKRTGSKPDGCAIIFKSSRLSLLSSNPVEFFRPGDPLLDRDNVGLVLLLQPNETPGAPSDPPASICVANTHLLYNPRRGDIKLAQLAILLAEIRRLSHPPDSSANPVVLCGDLNSTPRSPLYSFLTTGSLDYRGLQIGMVSGQESSPRGQRLLSSPIWSPSLGIDHQCQYRDTETTTEEQNHSQSPTVEGAISNLTVEDLVNQSAAAFHRPRIEHGLKLTSSYRHLLTADGRPEITTCHSRTAMTVDYIMYTPETSPPPRPLRGRGLQLLGRLSLVGESELQEVKGLPGQRHSSDHLPLVARFRLRP